MAEIVLAYCSSNAPMASDARMAASESQRGNFFGALNQVKCDALERDVEAAVMISNEHFTNFFLENFPQLCIGLGEENWCSTEEWLPIDKAWIPGHPGLANHIADHTLRSGFDPAFSHLLELGDRVLTVYHELDSEMQLPVVPIVQNCTVRPMMSLRRSYEFGIALGDAIRSYTSLRRVALIGAGGLSYSIGNQWEGDIDEEFDHWFLEHLEKGDLEDVLDLTDDELVVAGNGAHEIRNWLAVAGAMAPLPGKRLVYEAVHPWSTGMGVAKWEPEVASKHS